MLVSLSLYRRQPVDLFRLFRRKNPYEEFDKLLGSYRFRHPSASGRLRSYIGYHAKEFLYSLRRKRRIDTQALCPSTTSLVLAC